AGNLVARSILTGGVGPVLVQIASGGTGSISQSGIVFGGTVNFIGRGNVSVDAVRGTNVSITAAGGSVTSAGGSAIQSTGQLTLQATAGISVNTLTAAVQAVNGVSGNISITQAA